MFKVNNTDTRKTPLAPFWCLYCELWTDFTRCSSVSIVNFEQVNAGWARGKDTYPVQTNLKDYYNNIIISRPRDFGKTFNPFSARASVNQMWTLGILRDTN